MAKTITETKVVNYYVRDEAEVIARATIGEGQEGAWTMRLGDEFLKGGTEPEDVPIGNGKTLAEGDAHLEVSAMVKDIRPETDRLSLLVELKGGKVGSQEKISNEGDPGANASYSLIVRFL